MRKSKSGFTIVELLIVIVVTGILAAITIVAYNGIQTRAENTKTINSVAAYSKALTLYASDVGLYPAYAYPCLGNVSPCGNMTDSLGPCSSSGQAGSNTTTFHSALNTVATSLPSPSTQQMECNGKMYMGAYYYHSSGGQGALIRYFLKGDVSCPAISGTQLSSRYQNTGTTLCVMTFPTLP